MILEDLEKYISEDEDFNYYNFGFDVSMNDILIPKNGIDKLSTDLSGEIEGTVGVLEDVKSIIVGDMLNVNGQLKLPSDVSYASYDKSPAELALDVYNEALQNTFDILISDVDVRYDEETEKFE